MPHRTYVRRGIYALCPANGRAARAAPTTEEAMKRNGAREVFQVIHEYEEAKRLATESAAVPALRETWSGQQENAPRFRLPLCLGVRSWTESSGSELSGK